MNEVEIITSFFKIIKAKVAHGILHAISIVRSGLSQSETIKVALKTLNDTIRILEDGNRL